MLCFTGDMLKDGCASKAKQFSNKFTKTSTKARYHSHERSEGRRGRDKRDLGLDTALAENERDTLLREQQDVKEAILKSKTNASPPDENCTWMWTASYPRTIECTNLNFFIFPYLCILRFTEDIFKYERFSHLYIHQGCFFWRMNAQGCYFSRGIRWRMNAQAKQSNILISPQEQTQQQDTTATDEAEQLNTESHTHA